MVKKYQILCIDVDEQFINSLSSSLPGKVAALCEDFECCFEFVTSVEELNEVMANTADDLKPAMLISDQVLPGITGIDLIEKIKADHPDIVCIMLTGNAAMDSVKYAINRHLLDQYVSKPIDDMHVFVSVVANLLKRFHVNQEEHNRTEQLAQTVVQLRMSNEKISNMLTTAEQVTELANSLKSLDFDKVVEQAVECVSRIFQARSAVVCLGSDHCMKDCTRRYKCPCSDKDLAARSDESTAASNDIIIRPDTICEACAKLGSLPPDVMIPLEYYGLSAKGANSSSKQRGYLCICNINPEAGASPDLLKYKAGLVQEVINASLTSSELYRQAQRDSEIDYLTGTSTRRVLNRQMDVEYERALRYDRQFCLIIVDVDRFKSVNDTSGHQAGDNMLRELAAILNNEKRTTDILARYGGDEFAILLPETGIEGAFELAERMRNKVESSLKVNGQPLTISCGVAEWQGLPDQTSSDLLRCADAALYQAKQAGRNHVWASGRDLNQSAVSTT